MGLNVKTRWRMEGGKEKIADGRWGVWGVKMGGEGAHAGEWVGR